MAEESISYDKAELRAILKSFKAMDEEATAQAKLQTSELAEYVRGKIISASGKDLLKEKIVSKGAYTLWMKLNNVAEE